MSKIIISTVCVIMSLLLSIPTYAKEPDKMIYSGYTSDNIYYKVYEVETIGNLEQAKNGTIDVIRKYQYDGIIVPPSTKIYSEIIDEVTYTGTLTLFNCSYEGNYTIAYYQGTLTAIN